MKIGTGLGFSDHLDISENEIYENLAIAGFQCVDYPLLHYNYQSPMWRTSDEELRRKMENVRDIIHAYGLTVGQTHSPLDGYWGADYGSKELRWKAQIQAIKATAFLGAPYVVVHPLLSNYIANPENYKEAKQLNMEYYNFLKPYLQEYDVKLAIENLYTYDNNGMTCKCICSTARDLKDYVDTLDSERFVVCLDTGHALLASQNPTDMIYELGKDYLHVTHIHDNNSLDDYHMMPGAGKIDWYSVGKALHDIGYDGVFNFEADRPYYKMGEFVYELSLDLLKFYAELGKCIAEIK